MNRVSSSGTLAALWGGGVRNGDNTPHLAEGRCGALCNNHVREKTQTHLAVRSASETMHLERDRESKRGQPEPSWLSAQCLVFFGTA